MSIFELGVTQVVSITIICYLVGILCKAIGSIDKYIPCIVGFLGGVLGVVAMYVVPDYIVTDILSAIAIGIVSGLASTGLHQSIHQLTKPEEEVDE